MKEVKATKQPTLKQLSKMAANLQKKFNSPSMIGIDAWHNRVSFSLWVESHEHYRFGSITYTDSWTKLQDAYFSIMQKGWPTND